MTEKKKVPFEFKNEVEGDIRVLTLSGSIQKRYWSDDKYIDAKLIQDELEGVTGDIRIKLNSPGGDVFQGLEIYNYLKAHPSKVIIENTGLIGSAATFMLSAADEVIFNTGTSMMIHEASTMAWGNKTDIQKTLNALLTIDESIVNIYMERTNQSKEQITEWLNSEKWFTADEAVEYGFATSTSTIVEEPIKNTSKGSVKVEVKLSDELVKAFDDMRNEIQELENKIKNTNDTLEQPIVATKKRVIF